MTRMADRVEDGLLRRGPASGASKSGLGLTMATAAVALGVAAALAYGAASAPATWVLASVAGILLCLAILQRPLVGALAIVLLAGVVPRELLFDYSLPFAGGGLKVTDVLLLVTVGSWLLTRYTEPQRRRLPSKRTTWLLMGFLAVAALSLATSQYTGTPMKLGLSELRPLLSYLLIFVVVADLRDPDECNAVVAILLAGSAVASLEMLFWYVTGSNIGAATFTQDASRVSPTVFLLPLVGLIVSLGILTREGPARRQMLLWLLAAVNSAALFFTFLRGAWLAVAVGVICLAIFSLPRQKLRLVTVGAALLATALLLVIWLNAASLTSSSSPVASAVERLASVTAPSADPSAQHRLAEWHRALQVSGQHPLTGIGLGGTISFVSPLYSSETGLAGEEFTTSYLHNSYVWVLLKLGVPGLLLLVALMASILTESLRSYYVSPVLRTKTLLLGLVSSLLALMAVAATGPHLTFDAATPLVATVAGMIAAIPVLPLWRRTHPRDDGVVPEGRAYYVVGPLPRGGSPEHDQESSDRRVT